MRDQPHDTKTATDAEKDILLRILWQVRTLTTANQDLPAKLVKSNNGAEPPCSFFGNS